MSDTGHNTANKYRSLKNLVMSCSSTGCPVKVLLLQVLCSLKGSVSQVALGLRDKLTLDKLLKGLENHFGIVSKYDTLYRQLYHISQRPLETVTQFATRVSNKMSAIRRTYLGGIPNSEVDEVKQKYFYGGLRKELQLTLV